LPSSRPKFRSAIPKALPAEIQRPRLLARFEASDEVKLIALIAPSGFGKTTLLAQHARSVRDPVAWVALGEDDADPLLLSRSIALALGQTAADLPLEGWKEGMASGVSATGLARRLARDLDAFENNLHLILDGADVLGEEAGRWLERFVTELGEGHRVLLSAFESAPLGLVRLISKGLARLLEGDELAFTLEETATYLTERGHVGDARALHRQLDGWPAGVTLAAGGQTVRTTAQSLVLEVISRLPAAFQTSIPEAAVLEFWSEETAQSLGCALLNGWLREAVRVGLPLTPLERGAYRPHRVMLEVLEGELRKRPERHANLHVLAGQQAQAVGDGFRALRHYQIASRTDLALVLAEGMVERFEARWQPRLMYQVLDGFAEETLTPSLRCSLGQALYELGDAVRGESILRRLRASSPPTPKLLFALGSLESRKGQHQSQLELAEEGLGLPDVGVRRTWLMRLKASALISLGRLEEGLGVALEVARLAEAEGDLLEHANALTNAVWAQMSLGRWLECERSIQQALEICERLDVPNQQALLLYALAQLRQRQGRFEESLASLERALPMAESESSVVLTLLLITRGELLLSNAEFLRANADFQLALRRCDEYKFDVPVPILWSRLTEARLLAGDLRGALEALSWARLSAPSAAMTSGEHLAFAEGLLALEANDLEVATTWFQTAQNRSQHSTDPGMAARSSAYLAEIARRQGQLGLAQVRALRARLGDTDGWLWADAVKLEALFRACAAQGVPMGPNMVNVPLLEASRKQLEIITFGVPKVRIDGVDVHMPLVRCLEILVWLALHGPASRERIVDAVWDGSNDRRHVEYFKVAIRQLRSALTSHPAVNFPPVPNEDFRYGLASEFELHVDALVLAEALESNQPAALWAALEAYTGDFLPEIEAGWIAEARQAYHEEALAVALSLGAALEISQPQDAIRAYRRASQLEPLSEAAQLGLIRAHLQLNQRVSAEQIFTRFQRAVETEVGSSLSPEFQQAVTVLFKHPAFLPPTFPRSSPD
jgi:LuxR family maltose regulon positive regulatory protein